MEKKEKKDTETPETPLPSEVPGDVNGETCVKPDKIPQEDSVKKLETEILYIRAEAENMRKRLLKSKEAAVRSTQEQVWRHIFPIFVNLERAVQSYDGSPELAVSICNGVQMTLNEFKNTFNRCGLSIISGTECPFDPTIHEALDSESRSDLTQKTVLQEYEPGFMMDGRLIQPAKVKVGIPSSGNETTKDNQEE